MIDLFDLQPWAILAAALAGIVIGAAWYSPLLFGNAWMSALGKTGATGARRRSS